MQTILSPDFKSDNHTPKPIDYSTTLNEYLGIQYFTNINSIAKTIQTPNKQILNNYQVTNIDP
jgi:hypothetical protein